MDALELVHLEVNDKLVKLKKLFTADCKLTFLMRKPGMPSAGVFIGNDDIDEVIAQMKWFKLNEKKCNVVTPEMANDPSRKTGSERPASKTQERKVEG